MRQILQHLKSGEIEIADLPAPEVRSGALLIRTRRSLISAGTERMLIEFGRANLLQKARQQPERVKQALDKMRTDGVMPTLEAIFRKLDEPLPLGYCNAGVVLAVGAGVSDFRPGDRVISNGNHAEIVCVPRNLCARIPEGLSDEEAAFTVLGSIALQGLRLARPTLGERFVVFGVGLVGLLTVQLLRANGCEVLATDLSPRRLALAERYGARTVDGRSGDPQAAVDAWTGGQGADGAVIAASATTDEIVHQAATVCRKRGRIVLVGSVGLNLRRSDFFEKELTFQVSCSYGPGRYDPSYEQQGLDYPRGFVRWTEQRNFEAVLGAMGAGRVDVKELITDRVELTDAVSAYDKIRNDSSALGVVLVYPEQVDAAPALRVAQTRAPAPGQVVLGVIGAGNFSKAVLLPAIARTPARLAYIANRTAAPGGHAARKFGAESAVTDYRKLLEDPQVNAVFIVVGHHVHASMVVEALEHGKHVFVEKPLALNRDELDRIGQAVSAAPDRLLMVGYNRRFSPHVVKMRELLAARSGPLCMNMTVNAGALPAGHWTQDRELGGGRIIGEGCHFIDLLTFLAGSPIAGVSATMVGGGGAVREDKMSIVMGFADGSIGTVHYFANGSKAYPKEMLAVFGDGRVLRMENFRRTVGYGFPGFRKLRTARQDKGHNQEVAAFIERVAQGGEPLIPFDELRNVSLASFAAVASASSGRTLSLTDDLDAT